MISGRERDRRASHIPTDIAYEEGGYEVRVCVFEPGSADLAVRASLEAIDEVVNDFKQ